MKNSIETSGSQLIENFNSHYSSRSYRAMEPVSLTSGVDSSVIFIGSTISPLKNYLVREEIPKPGFSIIQPCFRSQRKGYFYDDSNVADYNSYFLQAGVLTQAERYRDVCEESLEFLTRKIGVCKRDLRIDLNKKDNDLCRFWCDRNDLQVVTNIHQDNYYRWNYGIEGFKGKGLTYSIRQNESEEFRDIGNIIIIYKGDQPVAVEWGFGVETLSSRLLNLPKPQAASRISGIVPFREGLQEKMLDSLVGSIEILKFGVEPGAGKESLCIN